MPSWMRGRPLGDQLRAFPLLGRNLGTHGKNPGISYRGIMGGCNGVGLESVLKITWRNRHDRGRLRVLRKGV